MHAVKCEQGLIYKELRASLGKFSQILFRQQKNKLGAFSPKLESNTKNLCSITNNNLVDERKIKEKIR